MTAAMSSRAASTCEHHSGEAARAFRGPILPTLGGDRFTIGERLQVSPNRGQAPSLCMQPGVIAAGRREPSDGCAAAATVSQTDKGNTDAVAGWTDGVVRGGAYIHARMKLSGRKAKPRRMGCLPSPQRAVSAVHRWADRQPHSLHGAPPLWWRTCQTLGGPPGWRQSRFDSNARNGLTWHRGLQAFQRAATVGGEPHHSVVACAPPLTLAPAVAGCLCSYVVLFGAALATSAGRDWHAKGVPIPAIGCGASV